MMRVHSVTSKPLEHVGPVAVAIGTTAPNQRHIGVLHRDADAGRLLMLHLRWHFRLSNDEPDVSFLWVDPAAHPKRLVQVAAICRQVWRANQTGGIPYGFSEPADCLDPETCKFLVGESRLGLTCASFVLAVFHRAGLQLVNYPSWPLNRPGDREWQESIINLLESKGAELNHVAALRSEVGHGAVRYRPEEIAGAATEASLPVAFSLASERGRGILEKLASSGDAAPDASQRKGAWNLLLAWILGLFGISR